jgi:protein-tyrosine phosphatase
MHQVPPRTLWLGHAGDGRDLRRLFDAGIRARVELAAEEAPDPALHDLVTCRFPLVDGAGNDPAILTLALRTVAWLLERKVPTLVCCGGGLSRSPAISAGAIALVSDTRPEECLLHVLSHRPADVVPALWLDVVSAVASLRRASTK